MLISVIIATYNRSEDLSKTLHGLARQQLSDQVSLEVVVVDNNSSDRTRETVQSCQNLFEGRLKYFFEKEQGKPFALNRGIHEAMGDVLVFTDDDVLLAPNWLKNLGDCFLNIACDGVGGKVLPIYPPNIPEWIKKHPHQIAGGVVIYDAGNVSMPHSISHQPFIGANYAFKKEIFKELGVFRTDFIFGSRIALGEDIEFINRLLKNHKILYYCATAVVWHPVDLKRITLRHIANWHIALGRYAARMEIEKKEHFKVYYLGVPRYIWKGLATDALTGTVCMFNRLKFHDAWRAFFRKIGMVQEYQSSVKK